MEKKTKKIILGLTGPIAGGKGLVAEVLQKKSFYYTSLSDRIREEVKSRGGEVTRENLQDVADELRKKFGSDVLAVRTWETAMGHEGNVVVDSIRSYGEVKFLKEKEGVILVGVVAPRKLRFQRIQERTREGDPLSWEEFVRLDEKDFKSGKGENGRNIKKCLGSADFLLENIGTKEELISKVEGILAKID